jgi:hypothetical protein
MEIEVARVLEAVGERLKRAAQVKGELISLGT